MSQKNHYLENTFPDVKNIAKSALETIKDKNDRQTWPNLTPHQGEGGKYLEEEKIRLEEEKKNG